MTSGSAAARPPRPAPRAEYVLAALAVLTFVLIPLRINTIYNGLPAHPLFLHVPVLLIPVVGIAALLLVARPAWFGPHGLWVAALTVVALAATDLTIGSGEQLRSDLHLGGGAGGFGDSAIVARHAHAADLLRILLIAFTAVLLTAFAAHRAGDASPLARLRRSAAGFGLVRAVLAGLAVACLYFVFHTGDLGAQAVWKDRVSRSGGRFPGGGFPGGAGFPGGTGVPGGGAGPPSGG